MNVDKVSFELIPKGLTIPMGDKLDLGSVT
jgi:hypothetical protein